MTAPSVARPRRPALPRRSGLAWRRARWGYVVHRPVDHRVPAVHPVPDDRHAGVHVHQHQPRPVRPARPSSGSGTGRHCIADKQTWDSLVVTLKYALLALPVAVALPLRLRADAPFASPEGVGRIPGPVLPAVRRPVHRRRPHLGRDAVERIRAGSTTACGRSGSAIRRSGSRIRRWIYSGLVIMGIWGIGAGMIVYLAGLKGIPSELVRRGADRRGRRIRADPLHHRSR